MVDVKSREYLAALRSRVAWRTDVEFVPSPTDDELRHLYQRSYGVLFTAPNEDFGFVPLEGMACGKVVIAPRRGGPTETVIDGETGILTTDEPRDFGAAITRVAQMSGSERRLMQSDARDRALEFDWKYFVARIDDHLDSSLVDGDGAGVRRLSISGSPR
jgi:glycosyltransferase involved in cell wall biosynthesis